MGPGRLVLALAVALAIGTIIKLWPSDEGARRSPGSGAPSASPVGFPPPPPSPPSADSSRQVTARSSSASDGEWNPEDMPAKVARHYAEAKDKRAFFDEAQKVGGGAYLMFARAAYMRCIHVNSEGMVGAEQQVASWVSQGDAYAQRIAAFRESAKGCEGFESRKVTPGQAATLTKRIYGGEDLVSLSLQVTGIGQEDPARARRIVSQAIATGDPYMLANLALYVGAVRSGMIDEWKKPASQRSESKERESAMILESNAWSWALCDLGYDCGPSSEMGLGTCVYTAVCGWKSFDEVADPMFAPQPQPGLRARKEEILAALRARDASKLGF